jgi:catechol 2,3-dioxygenase-like lactoylglutathione lyase family enzyme
MQAANEEEKFDVQGLFQAGVLVTDIEECLHLFRDALGLKVVFEARNVVQTAKGLSGVDRQIMNVLMLRGKEGVDLEIHQYVDPPAKPRSALNHGDIGSMHFMLRVVGIDEVVKKVVELGYKMMTPIVASSTIAGFKYAYFRGPDGMMVELQEGSYMAPRARTSASMMDSD